jgi:hypothetical protein
MKTVARTAGQVTLAPVAAVALVLAASAAANASATFNTVTQAQALKALPTVSQLPAGTKLVGKVKLSKTAAALPCVTSSAPLTLTGGKAVAAVYQTGTVTAAQPVPTLWTVTAVVFPSHAAAAKAALKLVAAEAKCPKTATEDGATAQMTVLAPDTSEKGLWKGVRSTAHVSATVSGKSIAARTLDTWFERGNVVVSVTETGPIAPNNQVKQDALRKAVTVATLARFDSAGA